MIAFIIFGWKGVTYTKTRGRFHCPQCAEERDFEHKRVRNFFTLYFIPLIPLGLAGEYIHCTACGGDFEITVLNWSPEAEEQEANLAIASTLLGALACMVEVDPAHARERARAARETWESAMGTGLPAEAFESAIAEVRSGSFQLEPQVAEVSGALTDEGREMFLRSLLAVAASAGEVGDREFAIVTRSAEAMGVTPTHLKGILSE
ncbi:MAG: zinc ribbon domain-containing protein [Planctomycetota bacterium]